MLFGCVAATVAELVHGCRKLLDRELVEGYSLPNTYELAANLATGRRWRGIIDPLGNSSTSGHKWYLRPIVTVRPNFADFLEVRVYAVCELSRTNRESTGLTTLDGPANSTKRDG